MRRPFLWPGVGLAMGVVSGRVFAFPTPIVFFLVLFLLPFLWGLRGKRFFLPLFLVAFLGIGILRIQQASRLPSDHIFYFCQGDWVSLEGEVCSLPEVKEKGQKKIYSFVLKAKNLVRRRVFFETRGKVQVFLFNPAEAPLYGSRVRMRGRLVLPKIPRNPGEFDYRHYLADQGIYAIFEGYGPRSQRILERRKDLSHSPLAWIQKLRDACAKRIDSIFPSPVNVFLKALILGIRKGLPDEFRDDFMKTGTTHLLAISGMNITLVAGSLFFLFLCLGLPQKAAAGIGLLSTFGYVFLSGAGIPVIRAGWMTGLFFTGLLLERDKDLLNSLFFALLAILVFDPKAIFQVGFQLSFLSVFSLLLLTPRRLPEWQGDWLQTAVVLVGTFPLLVWYFNLFSWVSLFANLLAIPLFHLGVLGGFGSLLVADIPVLGRLGVAITSFFLKGGLAWIQFWAQKPWGYFHLHPPTVKLILLYYAALALVLATQKLTRTRLAPVRPFSVSLWLVASGLFFVPPQPQNFSLTVVATGQNELLVVEFPGGNRWLVNAGRGAPSDQARWILSPLLRRGGVKHLQGILLTDFSRRHTGGLPTLLRNFTVEFLLFPGPGELPSDLKGLLDRGPDWRPNKVSLVSGDQVSIQDQGRFRIASVVDHYVFLVIDYEGKRFLLLPTWNSKVLRPALPRLKELAPIHALILPAWGGPAGSLGEEVLSLLSPEHVVFVRPNPVLRPLFDTLQARQIPFFFLSQTGALRFEVQKGELTISPFLQPQLTG